MDYAKDDDSLQHTPSGIENATIRNESLMPSNDGDPISERERSRTVKKLSKVIDISEEEAADIATWSQERRHDEIDRLKNMNKRYRALMLMVSLNSGWALYIQNINTFYLRSVLKINGAVVNDFNSNTALPWLAKPIWGFCSDSFFIFRYRFKSHIIIMTSLTIAACMIFVVHPNPNFYLYTIVNLLLNFATAYIDTMAEGMSAVITKNFERIQALEALDR